MTGRIVRVCGAKRRVFWVFPPERVYFWLRYVNVRRVSVCAIQIGTEKVCFFSGGGGR